jgi:hypothetical protein
LLHQVGLKNHFILRMHVHTNIKFKLLVWRRSICFLGRHLKGILTRSMETHILYFIDLNWFLNFIDIYKHRSLPVKTDMYYCECTYKLCFFFLLILVSSFREFCTDWEMFGVCVCFISVAQPLAQCITSTFSENVTCWLDTRECECGTL